MGTIKFNTNSIRSKVGKYLSSTQGRRRVQESGINAINSGSMSDNRNAHSPDEVAEKFLEVLKSSIESSGLSEGAKDAVSGWSSGGSAYLGNGIYVTSVDFIGEEFRFSLDVDKYGGISSIVALFNDGVDHTMRPVYGEWHGEPTWSRTVIPGTHFIDNAIDTFLANYASEYNVKEIVKRIN